MFFRCKPIEGMEPASGHLVEADPAMCDEWCRTQAGFPWPSGDECRKRFGEGHRLFALMGEGQPRCYGWVSELQSFFLAELERRATAETMMTWIWDCVTPVTMRNRGHYTAFLRALRGALREKDLLIFCLVHNRSSYAGILRAGFQPWASVTRSPKGNRLKVIQPRFRGQLSIS